MRFLVLHVDRFRSEITQKGRSPLREPFQERVTEFGEGLLVLVSVEKGDEVAPEEVAERAAAELADLAARVGARGVLLHSFAHLFAELARPEDAVSLLDLTVARLRERNLEAQRTPFGWFNTLELAAKGHPLSRVARQIRPSAGSRAQEPPSDPRAPASRAPDVGTGPPAALRDLRPQEGGPSHVAGEHPGASPTPRRVLRGGASAPRRAGSTESGPHGAADCAPEASP